MLRIEGMDVSIGSVSVLRKVDMEVPSGKFTGLIGRNGAGKSTLADVLMGLIEPDAGRRSGQNPSTARTAGSMRSCVQNGFQTRFTSAS